MNKRFYFSIIVIVIQIIFAIYLNSLIPAGRPIPVHWNIRGEVDGYTTGRISLFLFPLINCFILALMILLPFLSVRYRKASERFDKIIPSLTNILVLFFALIHIYTLLLATEKFALRVNLIFPLMGLMFILIGNILPKIPSNFFAGIRTPWTLSSEKVWRKTHRLGGFCFAIGGLLMILIPILWKDSPQAMIIMFVLFMIIVLYPVIHSFILFNKYRDKLE